VVFATHLDLTVLVPASSLLDSGGVDAEDRCEGCEDFSED